MATKGYAAIPSVDPVTPRIQPEQKRRRFISAAIACLAGIAIIGSLVVLMTEPAPAPKRNVIMMISDGFGPASETFARQYYAWREGLPPKTMLPLDTIHVGHSRTQSSSSMITDSAAGATAFSCAMKSYNGAIGVDPKKKPCGTVLEAAKLHHNMITGLVVTSRITHATPAAFSAHVDDREKENLIAEQQIGYNPLGRTVDLMFGGGQCEFMSNATEGSCRADGRDLLQEAKDHFGWRILTTRSEFDAITDSDPMPLMSLHALSHMPYEIDRNPSTTPSLSEMTRKALALLNKASKESDRGFFLMIEGSRIDMAAHTNDAAAHFYEIYEYHKTAEIVKQFIDENPNTVMISTSDHETGGLTVGRQVGSDYPEYKWNPEVIRRVHNSSEALALLWNDKIGQDGPDREFLENTIIRDGLGIDDYTEEELEPLLAWKWSAYDRIELENTLSELVSRRALVGFTTHGHTAVDVNLYAYGEGTEVLRGSHENTDIGDFIIKYLDLDLDSVTQKLASLKTFGEQSQVDTPKRPFGYHG